MLKIMRFLLLLYLLPTAAMAQSSLVGGLSTNATSPLPAGSCIYVDQGATTDTKLCSGYPAALGAAPIASPNFTGVVTMPSGAALATPATLNLTNATGLPYTGLPALSANQVLGAVTATTPSGLNMPSSCSGATNALIWTSGTGFGCNTISGTGTPGGTSGQIQYNNAGSFGGYTYVPTSAGGLGYSAATAANGSVPIGTGSGLTQATITGSTGVNVAAGSGTITISTLAPLASTVTSNSNVLSSQMGSLTPISITGGGTLTIAATGYGSTVFPASSFACFTDENATATTVTNSSGATMFPSITSIPYGATLCIDGDGTNMWATLTQASYGTVTSVGASTPNSTLTLGGTNPVTGSGTIQLDINLGNANIWTAAQTFPASGIKLTGSSTGVTTFTSANASATNYTITVPAATDTVLLAAATQTVTNKSIAASEINSGTVGSTYGGTGVNNGSFTITLGGSLVTSGAFTTTLTATAATNVTLPTAGTLATTANINTAIPSAATTAPECGSGAAGAVAACTSTMALPTGLTLPSYYAKETTQTSAYTAAATDCGTMIFANSSTTFAITLPSTLGSSSAACSIAVMQGGTAKVTYTQGSGATVNSPHSYTGTNGQYTVVGYTTYGTGTWAMTGDGS